MKKKYLSTYFFLIFLIMPIIFSCTSEAEQGVFFNGKSFEGILVDDLNSDKNDVKTFNLSFLESGKAVFNEIQYNYYDCIMSDRSYNELKPFLKKMILPYVVSSSPEELEMYAKDLFENLKKTNMFVLSTKQLEKVKVDLKNERFNFMGYFGLGWHEGDNYMVVINSTEGMTVRYIFGE